MTMAVFIQDLLAWNGKSKKDNGKSKGGVLAGDFCDLCAELLVCGRPALAQLNGFRKRQARVREREPGNRVIGVLRQGVAAPGEGQVDPGRAQEFQVAIEAAHVKIEPAHERGPALWTRGEQSQEP